MSKMQIYGHSVGPDKVMCRFKWDYPIVNLMSGHIRNCCRTPKQVITESDLNKYGTNAIMNLPYERERRLEKLQGITHKDCASCLGLEQANAPSPRTGVERFMKDYWQLREQKPISENWSSEFQQIAQRPLTINSPELFSHQISMLEIVLGNICDLKCIYCSPHYSNQWAKELMDAGELSREQYSKDFPEAPPSLEKYFWEWFYDEARYTVERINFLGGEPTYIPKFYDILDKLGHAFSDPAMKKRDQKVEIGVITNLNSSEANLEKFLTKVDKLIDVADFRIEPSMESVGVRAEYIRQNVSWQRFGRNMNRMLQFAREKNYGSPRLMFAFQAALNAISISSLPNFINWTQSLIDRYGISIGIAQNVISFPRQYNPLILTPDFAFYLHEAITLVKRYEERNDPDLIGSKWDSRWSKLRIHLLEGLFESMKNQGEPSDFTIESRIRFYEFTNQLKKRRGKDFCEIFPEYKHFYEVCQRHSQGKKQNIFERLMSNV